MRRDHPRAHAGQPGTSEQECAENHGGKTAGYGARVCVRSAAVLPRFLASHNRQEYRRRLGFSRSRLKTRRNYSRMDRSGGFLNRTLTPPESA